MTYATYALALHLPRGSTVSRRDGTTVNPMMRRVGAALAVSIGRFRPGAAARPPWERSVLDDVAMRRPWNLIVKAARVRARGRLRVHPLDDGVTVVIVNWNTREVLRDVVLAVQHLSPPAVRVLVVDNGSTDGSREMLRAWSGIDTILLPRNANHGVALDLAVCASRTTVTVTLDSDAIPLVDGWLDPAVEPVQAGTALLSGVRSRRGFAHPMYLAVNTEAFVRRRMSFQVHVLPGIASDQVVWGDNAWDTAELMTARLAPTEVVLIEHTPNAVDGLPGMTAAGVVYHHGGVSREADGGVTEEALAGWRNACSALGAAMGRTHPR